MCFILLSSFRASWVSTDHKRVSGGGIVQVEWHSGTKRQRQDFWINVVHNACESLLNDDKTSGEEEFRGHLRRLTKENNVPRKRHVEQRYPV